MLFAPGGTHDSRRPLAIVARALLFLVRAFRKEGNADLTAELAHLASAARLAEPDAPRPPAPASDGEIRSFLQSRSPTQRRQGLLLAALASCPSHREANFVKVKLQVKINMAASDEIGPRLRSFRKNLKNLTF